MDKDKRPSFAQCKILAATLDAQVLELLRMSLLIKYLEEPDIINCDMAVRAVQELPPGDIIWELTETQQDLWELLAQAAQRLGRGTWSTDERG